MPTFIRQLSAIGLAIILVGGLSPTIAHADTINSPSAKTAENEKAYQISGVEGPYTTYVDESGTTNVPWYSDEPSQIFDSETLSNDNFVINMVDKYSFDPPNSNRMLQNMVDFAKEPLTLTPGETLGDYMTQQINASLNQQRQFSTEQFTTILTATTYSYAWYLHVGSSNLANGMSISDIQEDYLGTPRDKIKSSVDSLSAGETPSFADELDTLSQNDPDEFLKQIFKKIEVALPFFQHSQLSEDPQELYVQLAKINPGATAATTAKLLQTPMIDFLEPQSDGTYHVNGALAATARATIIINPVFKADQPDVTPTPTPTPSQPITIHYVDEQGQQLKPDKLLTGAWGENYQAKPLTIAGYTLVKTTGDETGTFSENARSITYTYAKSTADVATPSIIAATRKVGLYQSPDFSQKTRQSWYAKRSQSNRPLFKVTGSTTSKAGTLRYHVKDINAQSQTVGHTGYITANTKYVTQAYYAKRPQRLTVINPQGLNAYTQKNLTGKRAHYRQGQVLQVKQVVKHNATTRFMLKNGTYVSGNKHLVFAGKQVMPKRVQAKTALNRYTTPNLTKRNHHYAKKAHATFKVLGWDYANANDFSKRDPLRYRVAGGYITANQQFVRTLK
ncbi:MULTISPECIES: DUF5776 domain-containing protein [Lactobacillaceae]|uniref:DUF5776 domain-containing protein n=1 Tax=Lactobacillaceae TaxID=33958 RepID=UPI0014563D11|nr:DUF5776 domain-containing protein [Lactobacillus sp. HBUAS51381]NLR09993.1 MucBP domain-containing protein [Lactobacillus sp. HBUAS51381]